MARELHNARIVQQDDGKFNLLFEDDAGQTHTEGPFADADAAAEHAGQLRVGPKVPPPAEETAQA